jgi:nicotinamidase-related amidase
VGDSYTEPDFAASALITIDTQCDTLDGAALEVPGTSAAVPAIELLARAFREAGRPLVHVVRLYEPDGGNVDLCRRRTVRDGARILAPGTAGSQLVGEVLPAPGLALDHELLLAGGIQSLGAREVAMYKPRWGAFYRTPLEEHLRGQNVSTLVFCGCNFPNCPRTSMYEASERDYRVVLARDAISALYERGERELENIGVQVMGVSEIADALSRSRGAEHSPARLPHTVARTAS